MITAKRAPYCKRGKPARHAELMNLPDSLIISTYGAEYRGTVQYHLLASDVFRFIRLRWAAETSPLKTLAARHRSTVTAIARKYRATITTPYGPRVCFQATVERPGRKPLVTRFGGIPLKRQKKAVITDRLPDLPTRRKELTTRLRTRRCEWGDTLTNVEVHQVRKLADLTRTGRPQPRWAQLMAKMRRKTLAVCIPCRTRPRRAPRQRPTGVPGNGLVRMAVSPQRDLKAWYSGEPDAAGRQHRARWH